MELLFYKYNYVFYFILFSLGFYAMMAKNNLLKKIIGMSILQASLILFFVSMGIKNNANIPIVPESDVVNAKLIANPLPHVLMLTAIVVGVSTLAVALSLLQKISKEYKSIEEDEILRLMEDE
ncbi:MAG: cation:proton antiporter subunit C [Bdellovibrionota bacterium]